MNNHKGRKFFIVVLALVLLCLPGISSTFIWNTFLGGGGADQSYGLAADSLGNVFVAGQSSATWGSPLRAYSGGNDVFVAKLDASGALLWHTFLGGNSNDINEGLTVDSSGNVYVSGSSWGTWGSPLRAFGGNEDAFAAKLDGNGNLLWNTFLGGSGSDVGESITVDSNGNTLVRGQSLATWGSPLRAYSSNVDVFAAKLDTSGYLLWNTFLGGAGADYGHGSGIAVDSSNNVFVAGYTMTSWGSPLRAHSGNYDAFMSKLDASGNLLWHTFMGGTGSDNSYSIAVDSADNVVLTGDSDTSWGSPVRAHSGGLDVFAAKLNGSGTLLWNTFLGGSAWDWIYGAAVDSEDNFLLAGKSAASWGSPDKAYSAGEDGFAAKVSGSGALLWNTFLGGSGADNCFAVAAGPSRSVLVAGTSSATWGAPIRAYGAGDDVFAARIYDNDPSAVLAMTAPVGGESWLGGSVHDITWTTTGTVPDVKLEYSTNSGADWTTIIASTANANTYSWTVPVVVSSNCLVRVSDISAAVVTDVSDAVFSIVAAPAATLTVTSPNGGEGWVGGSIHNITWNTTGTVANVKLEYSTDGGANWTSIDEATNTGTYAWTVPVVVSANCLVRVSETYSGTPSDVSNAAFTISSVSAIDRQALIDLYNATNGDAWTNKTGWKTAPLHTDGFALPGTENTWYGVTTDAGVTTVTNLNLANNNLVGAIPAGLGNLSNLVRLYLHVNQLSGSIPASLGNLTKVEELSLYSNQLTGSIPTELGNMSSLIYLHIYSNQLSGSIPASLGGLGNLISLNLSGNQLSGSIPAEMGNLSNLQYCLLFDNPLSGSIPTEMGNLSNLKELWLYNSQLTGSIPMQLGSLGNLLKLGLFNNQLSGNIPAELGNLSQLTELWLYKNQLTGSIPAQLGSLGNLVKLGLYENLLTGSIPAELGNLANLMELWVFINDLSGTIPAELANLTNLTKLDFYDNQLTGSIPTQLGALVNVQHFDFGINQLSGSIPTELGNLTGVMYLGLDQNQLTGSIPTELGNLTNLTQLRLGSNQLSGSIPASLGGLSNLTYLGLYINQLSGTIPPELGNLSKLTYLGLQANLLTGNIPPELGGLSNLEYLILRSNQLTSIIPPDLGNLSKLKWLYLHTNQLSGEIPTQIGSLTNLTDLDLHSNLFSGSIPTSLTNLTSLTTTTTNIGYNALYSADVGLTAFLDSKDSDWAANQTIAPTNIAAAPGNASAEVTWTPIAYSGDTGGYRVLYGTTAGGPYTFYAQTADKAATSQVVSGLTNGTPYYFVVQTRTNAHASNLNVVDSEKSVEATATPVLVPTGTLTVTSPNGGESWILGSAHNITWTSSGTIGNVKIEYSTDNGTSWATIYASTANDGTQSWTSGSMTDQALNTLSTTCRVRVSAVAGEALPDMSDGVFTIAASGFIHGTVTDLGGTPIPDVRVCAYDQNNVYISRGWTDAAGEYGIGGMVAGSYKILFDPTSQAGNYLYEWYNDQSNFNSAGSVAVTLNNVTEGVNAQLGPGGMVSGRVTDEGGAGLAGVGVTVWMAEGLLGYWYAETDANGDYQVTGLQAGNCRVLFGLTGYPLKWSGNSYSFEQSTPVSVSIGAETSGINMVLEKGGYISGTVTDGSGNPVSGIRILAYDATSNYHLRLWGNDRTAADGTYSVLVRAGQTKVLFDASVVPASGLRSQFYSNQTSFASAGSVSVVKDQTTPNINAVLAAGGGTVTVQVTNGLGQGVPASVYIYSALLETRMKSGIATDANGYVEIKGLIPGNYKVKIYDSNGDWGRYFTEWYDNALTYATATAVAVTEGGTTALAVVMSESAPVAPEINLKQGTTNIAAGGTYGFGSKIVGTDTDTVFTIENTGTDSLTLSGLPLSIAGTNADQFAVTVQPTSPVAAAGTKTFTVRFHPTSVGAKTAQISIANNDADENPYVLNLTGTGIDPTGTLTVTSPNGGENWAGGSIHNITWTTTGTVASVKLEYSANNGGSWTTIIASTANTNSYSWTLPFTASSQYLVRVSDAAVSVINDVSDAVFSVAGDGTEPNDDAASAAVLPMGTTENLIYVKDEIDWYKFFVPAGDAGKDLKVNVWVTSPYPDPIPDLWRSDIDFELLDGALAVRGVVFSGTDNETLYLPNVASGWYYIFIGGCTTDYADSTGFARYSISLEANTNFGLGYLSGRVLDGVGQGIEQVFLTLYNYPWNWEKSFPSMTTGAGGNFTIAFLPGTYDVNITGKADGSGRGCRNQAALNVVAEYYNDKKALALADHVGVLAGQTVAMGDIVLDTGAIVTGQVTDGSGNPLAGIFVGSYDAQANSAGNYVLTNAAGEYSLNGVPIGGAKIRFWDNPAVHAYEFYNDKPNFGSGNLLATAAGVTIPNINAQLTPGGSISGNVSNGLGVGLTIPVKLYSALDNTFTRAVATPDANGNFTFNHVKPGDYVIFFNAAGTAYASEWYADADSFAAGTIITVTEGNATTGINAQLAAPEINLKQGTTDIATGGTYGFGSKIVGTDTDTVFTIENTGTDSLTLSGLPLSIAGTNADQFAVTVQPTSPVAAAGTKTFTVRFHPTSVGAKTAQISIANNDGDENPYVLNLTGTGIDAAGTLTVTSPNGGESWILGSTHNITWTSSGTIGNVKIEYSTDDGATWKTIYATTPNDGTQSWTSGSMTDQALNTLSTTCRVRVSDVAGGALPDISDGVFTIAASGFIHGTVTDLGGTPIQDVRVCAYDLNNVYISRGWTDAAGEYGIGGMVAGSYKLLFDPTATTGNYLYEWYNDQSNFNSAGSVAVTLNNVTEGINAQLGPGGIVSGRVTDEGGAGLAGVGVTAFMAEALFGYWYGETDANGDYQVKGIQAGNCRVLFGLTGYPMKWYGNSYSFEQSTPVSVSIGAETSGINMVLEKGGYISGTVTDGGGNPVSGIRILAYDATSNYHIRLWGNDRTAADGTYSVLVRAGQTKVLFDASVVPASGLRSQFYSNQTTFGAAGTVNVVKDQTTPNINAVLAAGGGTITVQVTNGLGQGVPASVYIYSALLETRMKSGIATDANGYVEIKGLIPGDYKVKIYDSNGDWGRYFTEWYDNALTYGTAIPVAVTEGGTTALSVVMSESAPVAPEINLKQGTTDIATGGTYGFGSKIVGTDTDAVFTIENLGTDSLILSGLPLSITGTNADQFAVTVQPTSPVAASGNATFTVRFHPTSVGAKTAQISIANNDGDENPYVLNLTGTGTDAAGTLTVTSPNGGESWILGSAHNITWTSSGTIGNVKIEYSTDNGTSWATIYASTANDGTQSWTSGSMTDQALNTLSTTCRVRVSAVAGEALPDMSDGVFTIAASGFIHGTVTDLGGTPIPDVRVCAYDQNNVYISRGWTDAAGEYGIGGMVAGSYKLLFDPTATTGNYLYEWYNDQPSFNTGGSVAVTLNNVTEGINAQLGPGGIVSGRVTDEGGAGLEGVGVTVWLENGFYGLWYSETDANGDYRVSGLPAGNVRLMYTLSGYPPKYYSNGYTFETAANVPVTIGAETTGINLVLERGGTVSGTVTDGSGSPVSGIRIIFYDAASHDYLRSTGTVLTAADGTYSILVRAGQTKVYFDAGSAPASGLRSQYYSNQGSFASGGAVSVVKDQTTPNINAQLAAGGGTITVQVTNGLGQGLPAAVYLYDPSYETRVMPATATDAGGYVEIKGLIPGNYKVKIYDANGEWGRYFMEWYNNALNHATAAPVAVTEGGTTALSVVMSESAPVAPEINLKQGTTDIAAGGTYGFGSKIVGTDTDAVFTIENVGTDSLTLTGLPLSITGTNADQFSLTAQPTSPIAAAGSATFTVRFHPTSAGAKTAQVSIANNDSDENPYVLNLTGTGTDPVATLALTSPNGGESWIGGTVHNITWTTTGTVANVKLEYSANNGGSWTTIIASTANTNSYSWTLPLAASVQYLVRVSDAGTGTPVDTSNAVFSITLIGISGTERTALIDFYNATNGDSWTNNTGWKTAPLHTDGFAVPGTEKFWRGVTTDSGVTTVLGLDLPNNNLVGSLPASLGNLSNLKSLQNGYNWLTGSIPASLGNLINLKWIDFTANLLTGSIPPEIENLSNLISLYLGQNLLTGNIPAGLGNLSNLTDLSVRINDLTGSIPASLGNLSNLKVLYLGSNQLSGNIPPELGNLINLIGLELSSNKLSGSIPASLTNLTSLTATTTNIGYNALYSLDAGLTTFLDSKDADWAATQTIAPTNVTAAPGDASAEVSWTPVAYTGDTGGYRVLYGTTAGGPYTFYAQTADKTVTSQVVSGLTNGTPYYFVVQTRTNAHGNNQNIVDSENSVEATATPVFVPTGTLTLTSPNGGESWILGSTHNITWTSSGTIGNVKIEYSTDDGATWKTIYATTPNDGTQSWTSGSMTDQALNTLSTTCRVRVSDVAGGALPDISDGVFTIAASGFIHGTVTDLGGTPIPDVRVCAYDQNNVYISRGWTDAAGEYGIGGMVAGSYKLLFDPTATTGNYLYEWYNDQPSFNAGGSVAVTLNNVTEGVNAQLGPGGIVSGRVTDEGGAGLAGVGVTAWMENGLLGYWYGETDANGDYRVKGIQAGNCRVLFGLTGYPMKWYGNSYSFEQSTPVSVSIGAETSGINMVLEKGGYISGTVTDGGGNPVSGIRILAYDATSNYHIRLWGNDRTAADGTYSVLVRAGQTKVLFDASVVPASGLRSQFYSNQTTFGAAGTVNVVKDQTTPNINAVLAAGGGTITVQVTNGLGQGVPASVYLYSTLYETRMKMGVATDANGYVEIKGLIPGDYKVKIYDSNGDWGRYFTEWYDNALTYGTANAVNVTEGGTTALAVVLSETAPVAPEINLKQGTTNIAAGGTYGFGSKIVGTDTDAVFTIENVGTDSLTLTGLPLSITGTNADQFSITAQPTSPVAAAGSTTFTVRFHPTSVGAKTAQISIANNDGDENPYILNLTGTGTDAVATLALTSPNGGESWIGGTVHNITWTTTGTVANVKLQYSTNNGGSWTTIIASTANTGTYAWTVPGVVSANCLILISGAPSGIPTDASNAVFSIIAGTPTIHLSKTTFNFGSEQNGTPTPAETAVVSNGGTGVLNWTATPSAAWLGVAPGSGTGAATLTISIVDTSLSPGNYVGTITVADPGATNSPQVITVNFQVYNSGADSPPFGAFETPAAGSTVASSIPVTGWVLDDVGMEGVKIYRGTGEADRVYIGDAVLVRGARPDVEAAYPGYPQNSVAGWGYMLLTNFLPNSGNGTFTLLAYAKDTFGHEVLLGTKTITCDNANAVLPFGAIDTPAQGGTASGSAYMNFGWALTPRPNSIPLDGSTILVWVDGAPLAHPSYNHYRGDIATLFPGYVNSNGAVGLYFLNTTSYTDAVHTIAWSVMDSAGNVDGIGSRYFSILNAAGGPSPSGLPSSSSFEMAGRMAEKLADYNEDSRTPVYVRLGMMPAGTAEKMFAGLDGSIRITIPEVTRVAVYLNEESAGETEEGMIGRGTRMLDKTANEDARYEAYQLVLGELRPLPIGASFDPIDGVLYWQPGPGFLGEYHFIVIDREMGTKRNITVTIRSK